MKVLLLGAGGREHALARGLAASPGLTSLFIAPGNAGTSEFGQNVALLLNDFQAIEAFARTEGIGLIVVGPEEPLVNGIVDYFEATNIPILGPNRKAAQLEGSKDFAKRFLKQYDIPTAKYSTYGPDQLKRALAALDFAPMPVVLKADGLAAGKGVFICQTPEEASVVLTDLLANHSLGEAGAKVVVEQFLQGPELSIFVLSDGTTELLLPEAKDYKRIGEGETGPNTGGMGSISPVPFATPELMRKIQDKIITPTFSGLRTEGLRFKGFLFIGLMIVQGEPYVLEFNVRMGDPETQSVIPRIETDLVQLFHAAAVGKLVGMTLKVRPEAAATVVCVAQGYPGTYAKGEIIKGLEKIKGTQINHAGTQQNANHELITAGGRVLGVTSHAPTLKAAIEKSLAGAALVEYSGKYYRKDIGQDVL